MCKIDSYGGSMLFASVVLMVVAQDQFGGVHEHEFLERMARQSAQTKARQAKASEEETKRDLAQRFNKLISALKSFEQAYAGNKGEVWPAKQAAKLEQAMRQLPESPGWRKSN